MLSRIAGRLLVALSNPNQSVKFNRRRETARVRAWRLRRLRSGDRRSLADACPEQASQVGGERQASTAMYLVSSRGGFWQLPGSSS